MPQPTETPTTAPVIAVPPFAPRTAGIRSSLRPDDRDALNVAVGLVVGLVIVAAGIVTTRGMQEVDVEPEPPNYEEAWRLAMRGFLIAGFYVGFARETLMQYGLKKTTWEALRDVLLKWQGELYAEGEGKLLARFGQGYAPFVDLVLAHEAMNTREYPVGPPPEDEVLCRWSKVQQTKISSTKE